MAQLPPGFVLDEEPQASANGLPPGFVLDEPANAPQQTVLQANKRDREMSTAEYAEDALRAGRVGVAKGVTGIAGLPGEGHRLGTWLGDLIAEKLGMSEGREAFKKTMDFGRPQTGSEMFEEAQAAARPAPNVTQLVTGEQPQGPLDYKPKTIAGEYGQTIGEFIPGAIGPGGPIRKAAEVIIPALASETAGQVTKGTEAEPWARLAAGAIGGVAAAGSGGSVSKIAAKGAPTQETVKAGADALYDKLRNAGITYDANSYDLMARNLAGQLRQKGFRGRTAKETADTLDYIFEHVGTSPDYGDFAAIRENAGQLLRSADKRERLFGGIIVDALDNFASKSPLITNGSVPANQVAPLMKEARGLAQRNIKARVVEDAIEAARNTASGFENGLRIEFRKILNNPKRRAGFTPTEIEAFKEIVRGTTAQNLAAQIGRLGIGTGTKTAKSALLPLMAGGGGAAIDPLIGAGVVATASGIKYAAAKNAERIADRTVKTVLAGKDAQRKALLAKRAEQLKVQLRRLLALDNSLRSSGALSPEAIQNNNGGNR